MRLLLVVEQFPGITETFISSKVKKLLENGNEVIIVCNKQNPTLFGELFPAGNQPLVKSFSFFSQVSFLFNRRFIKHAFSLKNRRELKCLLNLAFIDRFKADVVHFEFSAIGLKYAPFLHLLRSKLVISCRGTAEKVKLPVSDERRHLFKLLVERAEKVHCVSNDMASAIAPFAQTEGKIEVIYPAVDEGYFSNSLDQAKGLLVVLSVGRLVFAKGYSFALYTMSILKQRNTKFKWIIIGEGDKMEELQFKINCFNLQDEVVLGGARSKSEIRRLMSNATVFFLPSVYEGVANVVLEAMSMKLPVVATDCGGMPEIIENGKNGIVCNTFDFESQADAIVALSADSDLRKRMGLTGRKTIEDRYTLNHQALKLQSFYNGLSS